MPVLLSLALIGLFVFFAENLCTWLSAWVYPHQSYGWRPVEAGKVLAWTLMSTVAFIAITLMNGFSPDPPSRRTES